MPLGTKAAGNGKPSETFYDAYLAVIYGLVATKGLEIWVDLNSHTAWHLVPPYFPLFLGIFIAGLHFWFTCTAVEGSAWSFYCALVGKKWSALFLFADALVATGFAGISLAMFSAIPEHLKMLFRWFIFAAIASLLYDCYARVLVFLCERRPRRGEEKTVSEYKTLVHQWFVVDGVFSLGALLVCLVSLRTGEHSYSPQIALLLVSTTVLVLDVKYS